MFLFLSTTFLLVLAAAQAGWVSVKHDEALQKDKDEALQDSTLGSMAGPSTCCTMMGGIEAELAVVSLSPWHVMDDWCRCPLPAALERGDVARGFISASLVCVVSASLQPVVKETEAKRLDGGGFFDVGWEHRCHWNFWAAAIWSNTEKYTWPGQMPLLSPDISATILDPPLMSYISKSTVALDTIEQMNDVAKTVVSW
jgi:hypothetical protein